MPPSSTSQPLLLKVTREVQSRGEGTTSAAALLDAVLDEIIDLEEARSGRVQPDALGDGEPCLFMFDDSLCSGGNGELTYNEQAWLGDLVHDVGRLSALAVELGCSAPILTAREKRIDRRVKAKHWQRRLYQHLSRWFPEAWRRAFGPSMAELMLAHPGLQQMLDDGASAAPVQLGEVQHAGGPPVGRISRQPGDPQLAMARQARAALRAQRYYDDGVFDGPWAGRLRSHVPPGAAH